MYFPLDVSNKLRHPSQLYEALFEGILLFIILWSIRKKRLFDGIFLSLYFIAYGSVRFFIEFVRDPDPQVGLFLRLRHNGTNTLPSDDFDRGRDLFMEKKKSSNKI